MSESTTNYVFDFFRPNHYMVVFKPSNSITFSKNLGVFCKSVTFPFFTFDTSSILLNNKNNTMINKIDYDPVSFTFNVDDKKEVLNFIIDWKKLIINDKYQFGYKDDYKIDIDIILLDNHTLEEISKCTLIDAILLNVDGIAMSYETKDSISEITLSVGYDDIKYEI